MTSERIDLEIEAGVGNGGGHCYLPCQMEYSIGRKLPDRLAHVIPVADITVDKTESALIFQPAFIFQSPLTVQVVKNDDIIPLVHGMNGQVAPQKTTTAGNQDFHGSLCSFSRDIVLFKPSSMLYSGSQPSFCIFEISTMDSIISFSR